MKRRQLMRYAGASLLAAIGAAWASPQQTSQAQSSDSSLNVQWLGHSCFLFTSNGFRVLVNPFRPLGCTAGYPAPKVAADLVLISSFLLDEGAVEQLPGNPRILTQAGDYQINNTKFQGITLPHDREGGRRFGTNIAWRWTQGGIDILHLGGAAGAIGMEQRILMGSPDLVLIPVGGGPKAYNPQEAIQAIGVLKPRIVIPTQYLTAAADKEACNLVPVDDFLALTEGAEIRKLDSNSISFTPSDLSQQETSIRVFSYNS
ncbi:MBL fold metallo-hydrolase [Pleurocapsales cyanobacterium LEGE 06147]|nr:MBL fold metallo-hydrolase [Pleurocapsales cyanobacterium LEGE 06147]